MLWKKLEMRKDFCTFLNPTNPRIENGFSLFLTMRSRLHMKANIYGR